jgi:hypothetical protein
MSLRSFQATGEASSAFCTTHYFSTSSGLTCAPGGLYEPSWTPNTIALDANTGGVTTGQACRKSASQFALSSPFLSELQATASVIRQNNASLTVLMSPSKQVTGTPYSSFDSRNPAWTSASGTSDSRMVQALQFGDPSLNVYTDTSSKQGFSISSTLNALSQSNLTGSLQATILAYGGSSRLFDISSWSSSQSASTVRASSISSFNASLTSAVPCHLTSGPGLGALTGSGASGSSSGSGSGSGTSFNATSINSGGGSSGSSLPSSPTGSVTQTTAGNVPPSGGLQSPLGTGPIVGIVAGITAGLVGIIAGVSLYRKRMGPPLPVSSEFAGGSGSGNMTENTNPLYRDPVGLHESGLYAAPAASESSSSLVDAGQSVRSLPSLPSTNSLSSFYA